MKTYTPGPWTGEGYGDIVANGIPIASVLNTWEFFESAEEAQAFQAERNANIRLIAAAPDLLTACELGRDIMLALLKAQSDNATYDELKPDSTFSEMFQGAGNVIDLMTAAIKRAKGETP